MNSTKAQRLYGVYLIFITLARAVTNIEMNKKVL